MANKHSTTFHEYETDPRKVLAIFTSELKKGGMVEKDFFSGELQKLSLGLLALSIIKVALDHLRLLQESTLKFAKGIPGVNIAIDKDQKVKIYFELLSLYYFLIGQRIRQDFQGERFTLFTLKLLIAILDTLPTLRDTMWLYGFNPFTRERRVAEMERDLSLAIMDGERFYIRDDLGEEEKQEIADIKPLIILGQLAERSADYGEDLILQIIVKSYYRIVKILGLSTKDLDVIVALHLTNYPEILYFPAEKLIELVRPLWEQIE